MSEIAELLKNMSDAERRELSQALQEQQKKEEAGKQRALAKWEEKRDEFISQAIGKVKSLQNDLQLFKLYAFEVTEALQAELMQLKNSKRLSQSNYFFVNADSTMKVEVNTHYRPEYGETLNIGIGKMHDWIESTIKKADKKLAVVVQKALSKDSKGEYNANKLMELISLEKEINDPLFSEACDDLRSSFKKGTSNVYMIFRHKVRTISEAGEVREVLSTDGKWKRLTLQFSEL